MKNIEVNTACIIKKNYEDMDLKNSELNTKFEEIVERMEQKCDDLKRKISSYTLE